MKSEGFMKKLKNKGMKCKKKKKIERKRDKKNEKEGKQNVKC